MWSWKSFLQISHIEVTEDICINILVLSGLLSRLCKQRRSLRSCKCSSNTSKPVCRTNNCLKMQEFLFVSINYQKQRTVALVSTNKHQVLKTMASNLLAFISWLFTLKKWRDCSFAGALKESAHTSKNSLGTKLC